MHTTGQFHVLEVPSKAGMECVFEIRSWRVPAELLVWVVFGAFGSAASIACLFQLVRIGGLSSGSVVTANGVIIAGLCIAVLIALLSIMACALHLFNVEQLTVHPDRLDVSKRFGPVVYWSRSIPLASEMVIQRGPRQMARWTGFTWTTDRSDGGFDREAFLTPTGVLVSSGGVQSLVATSLQGIAVDEFIEAMAQRYSHAVTIVDDD